MRKDRFEFICQEAQAGSDAFVSHPSTQEEGRALECSMSHILVQTSDGNKRCWDYSECEEMSRSSAEFPYR